MRLKFYYRSFKLLIKTFFYLFKNSFNYPKVTIIVPLYNEDVYLNDCLKSIQKQYYSNWECIIVNDASTNDCVSVAQEHSRKDPRFKIIHHEVNMGLSAARNTGIKNSTGEFILFLDADDLLLRSSLWARIEKLMLFKEKNQKLLGVHGAIYRSAENEVVPSRLDFRFTHVKPASWKSHGGKSPFVVHAPLLIRERLVKIGFFDETMKTGAEDWDFWIRAFQLGYEFFPVHRFVGVYRQKESSMVRQNIYEHALVVNSLIDRGFGEGRTHEALKLKVERIFQFLILAFYLNKFEDKEKLFKLYVMLNKIGSSFFMDKEKEKTLTPLTLEKYFGKRNNKNPNDFISWLEKQTTA